MKFAWRSLTTAPPMRGALQPGLVDQLAGVHARRIFEDAARALVAHRLPRLADNPLFLQAFGHTIGIVFFQFQLGVKDHRFVEAALAIVESEFLAVALVDLAAIGDNGYCGGPLADFPRRGVPAFPCSAPPRVPGMATSSSMPAKTGVGGGGDDPAQSGTPAGRDNVADDLDLAKGRLGQRNDYAMHTFVADEDIGAASQNTDRHVQLPRASYNGDEVVDARRFGEEFGRSAELEPRVHGQRLSLAARISRSP